MTLALRWKPVENHLLVVILTQSCWKRDVKDVSFKGEFSTTCGKFGLLEDLPGNFYYSTESACLRAAVEDI